MRCKNGSRDYKSENQGGPAPPEPPPSPYSIEYGAHVHRLHREVRCWRCQNSYSYGYRPGPAFSLQRQETVARSRAAASWRRRQDLGSSGCTHAQNNTREPSLKSWQLHSGSCHSSKEQLSRRGALASRRASKRDLRVRWAGQSHGRTSPWAAVNRSVIGTSCDDGLRVSVPRPGSTAQKLAANFFRGRRRIIKVEPSSVTCAV